MSPEPRPALEAAIERLQANRYTLDYADASARYLADLALLVAAAQAGARGEERARAIEERIAVVTAQPNYPDTHTGVRQQWVKAEIIAKFRALLPPEAPRAGTTP